MNRAGAGINSLDRENDSNQGRGETDPVFNRDIEEYFNRTGPPCVLGCF